MFCMQKTHAQLTKLANYIHCMPRDSRIRTNSSIQNAVRVARAHCVHIVSHDTHHTQTIPGIVYYLKGGRPFVCMISSMWPMEHI